MHEVPTTSERLIVTSRTLGHGDRWSRLVGGEERDERGFADQLIALRAIDQIRIEVVEAVAELETGAGRVRQRPNDIVAITPRRVRREQQDYWLGANRCLFNEVRRAVLDLRHQVNPVGRNIMKRYDRQKSGGPGFR